MALHVLHLLAPAEFGGLERVVHDLALAQHRDVGVHVSVAVIVHGAGEGSGLLRNLRAHGVDCHELVVAPRAYFAERRAVEALCRNLRPAVLHTHGYRPDVVDAGIARRRGVARVTTVHGFTGTTWRNHFYEWLQCRAFRSFEAVVAVARALAGRLRRAGVPADRIHVVRNAVAPPRLLPASKAKDALDVPKDVFHVGWVGRLSHEKGPDLMVDALERAEFRSLPARVTFVGDGPMRGFLEDRVADRGLGRTVRFAGAIPDASRLFRAFDLIVLSSRTEGTPMVLLEGMASGVPIVATAVGGVPDVVDSRIAWLVPPDPTALGEALLEVVQNPDAAEARAAAAQRHFQSHFNLSDWADAYSNVYGAAVSRLS